MIKKIVAATDGSKAAANAVNYAARLAKDLGAALTLLGVIDRSYLLAPGVPLAVSPGGIHESPEDLLKQATQAYLDDAEAECRNLGVEVSKAVRTGHPVEEIIRGAEAEHADLIVLGSHGRSALQAALLGSVAFGVVHKDTRIPVLIVRR